MVIGNFSFNVLDLIIVLIMAFSCYMGYKRGLLLTVYKLVSIFLAIWIAWAINPLVKDVLINFTGIDEYITECVEDGLTKEVDKSLTTGDESNKNEEALEKLNLPSIVKNYLYEQSKDEEETEGTKLATYVAEKITSLCMSVISFLLVVILVAIILSLLKGILQLISQIPIIDEVDKIAGLAFGVIYSGAIIWILLVLVGLFMDIQNNVTIYNYITSSTLCNWFYNNNIISYILIHM